MLTSRAERTALQAGIVVGSVALIGVILWLDVRTTIWQEMVVLSGLAAGLVSFLLTTVFVQRLARRQLEARWAPVTHLALTEMLHALADDDRSDLSRGRVVPQTLREPVERGGPALAEELDRLRNDVLAQRQRLAATLGIWSQFLASTSDNDDIMRTAAELARQFDRVRDSALEAEGQAAANGSASGSIAPLLSQLRECNEHHARFIAALQARLHAHRRERGTAG